MKNKICIVTGANSGIGYETALSFAKQGAKLLMVCRNKEKGTIALNEVKSASQNNDIELIIADFSSQKDIRRAAQEINNKYQSIDILINNAGAIQDLRNETVDGYETTFATNHLGYFLFTNLLLDKLKTAPKARIINVASSAQQMGKLNFDDLHLKNGYTPMKAYAQSKLANIVFTYELAKRLKNTNITTNCVHPGVVRTGFAKDSKGIVKFFFSLAKPFMRNAVKGAETMISLSTSPELEGVSGNFYFDKKIKKSIPDSYNDLIQKRLWEESEKLTNL